MKGVNGIKVITDIKVENGRLVVERTELLGFFGTTPLVGNQEEIVIAANPNGPEGHGWVDFTSSTWRKAEE